MGLYAEQLQQRFGKIRREGNLTAYQKGYKPEHEKDFAWLGDSPFMVEFKDGRVVGLYLCKG